MTAFNAARAKVLKAEGESRVYRAVLLGHDVVIKVRNFRGVLDRVKWWTRSSRGFRQWRGATWLIEHGFDAARPLLLASDSRSEWFVMEAVPGKTLIQHIADGDLPVRAEHSLARQLGRHISAMRKAGCFNRDFKPSNIIVRPEGRIVCIDCVAIRRGAGQPQRMLHALAVEPLGLGVLPRRAIQARVIHEMVEADYEGAEAEPGALRLAKWATRRGFRDMVLGSIRKHGDPTPRTNPLTGGR